MNIIEKQFYHLAEQNKQCDSWLAQWKIAKKRAPMILDVISHVFPHYCIIQRLCSCDMRMDIICYNVKYGIQRKRRIERDA